MRSAVTDFNAAHSTVEAFRYEDGHVVQICADSKQNPPEVKCMIRLHAPHNASSTRETCAGHHLMPAQRRCGAGLSEISFLRQQRQREMPK